MFIVKSVFFSVGIIYLLVMDVYVGGKLCFGLVNVIFVIVFISKII